MKSEGRIALLDLGAQRAELGSAVDDAIQTVIAHGQFIMGPEVEEFESALGRLVGVEHVISCGSGTEALLMPLVGWEIGAEDAVFVPSYTFAATAEVVRILGGRIVFVDVLPDTFNMDPASLGAAVQVAIREGLRPSVVIPVDLFGAPADYEAILYIAEKHHLKVLCDAAQSLGATYLGEPIGSLGCATATSFFPSKPLGCYGDGGAIFTDDAELAAVLRSIRVHGQGEHKYDNVRVGINGRLDTLQAAILNAKLRVFPAEIERRREIARAYNSSLVDVVDVPEAGEASTSAWAQYTIRSSGRDDLRQQLNLRGIPSAVYYPRPLHLQPAYSGLLGPAGGLAVSEELSTEALSLPLHPYLTDDQVEMVVHHVRDVITGRPGTKA